MQIELKKHIETTDVAIIDSDVSELIHSITKQVIEKFNDLYCYYEEPTLYVDESRQSVEIEIELDEATDDIGRIINEELKKHINDKAKENQNGTRTNE